MKASFATAFVVAGWLPASSFAQGNDEFSGLLGPIRRQAYVGETFRYEYDVTGLVSMPDESLRLVVDLAFDGMPVLHVERIRFEARGRLIAIAAPYFVWVEGTREGSHEISDYEEPVDTMTRVLDRSAWESLERHDGAALRALFAEYERTRGACSLTTFDRLPERERTPLAVDLVAWRRTTDNDEVYPPSTRRAIGEFFVGRMSDSSVRAALSCLDAWVAPTFRPVSSTIAGEHPPQAIVSHRWPRGFAECVNVRERVAGEFHGAIDRFGFRGRTQEFSRLVLRLSELPNSRVELVLREGSPNDGVESRRSAPAADLDGSLTARWIARRRGPSGDEIAAHFSIRLEIPVTSGLALAELDPPSTVIVVASEAVRRVMDSTSPPR